MNILVCVKQVPDDEDLKLDPETKTLVRTQGKGKISEYDKYALEIALRLKDEVGGSVTAMTMGPPASEEALRYCLSVGADDVYLLSDRAMGGADAYATATVLAAAAQKLPKNGAMFDLILLGKQASDSDTSLVMPELAEALNCSQVTFVTDCRCEDDKLYVLRETDAGTEEYFAPMPVVLSVGKTAFPLRYPTIKLKIDANRRQIPAMNASDLNLLPELVGAAGSKTTVGASYFPEHIKTGMRIAGVSSEEAGKKLVEILRTEQVI